MIELSNLVKKYGDHIAVDHLSLTVEPVSYTHLDVYKRQALQNATSVTSTLLTTESAVATIKGVTPAMPAGAGAGMGMM